MIEMNDFINMFSSADPSQLSTSVKLIILLTILSIAPGILILMTSFTRIIVVLSFVRTSLATQQMPPNQVLIGLALFLTFFIWHQRLVRYMMRHYNRYSTKRLHLMRHMIMQVYR